MFQDYYGTKRITAKPMTRGEYNELRGWQLPTDESGADEGYLVIYSDDYKSWSPKAVFDEAYQPLNALSYGHAVAAAKAGRKIARAGWNGKGMFVVYMPELNLPPYNTQGTDRKVNDRTAKWIGEDTPLESLPYFAMFTAQQKWQPGWLASQSDMLANDWMVLGDTLQGEVCDDCGGYGSHSHQYCKYV